MPWCKQLMKDAVNGETPREAVPCLDPWVSEWGNPALVMQGNGMMNT
jgi:hypothetical protein